MLETERMGKAGAPGALFNQRRGKSTAERTRTLVGESLNQNVEPPKQLRQTSPIAAQLAEINQLDRAATIQDLVEEVLNQSLMPPRQIANTSATDSERSDLDTWTKSIDDLVQEALNQTLKLPKQFTSQPDKDIRQSISMVQKLIQAVQGIEMRLEAMQAFSEGKNLKLPYNGFLEEMRREALIAAKEIDDIVSQTEPDGNRLFGDRGQSIHISLTDGAYIEVKAEDFQLEAVETNPATRSDIEAFQLRLREKLTSVREYWKVLEQHSGQLEAEIKQTESKLVHDMGIGPNEVNTDMAAEIAVLASSDMVSSTMKESLDAQQVHGLLKNPIPSSLS
jgi:hypothetical protein